MRLIDADALLEKKRELELYFAVLERDIENAPTINPADLVPKGRWVGEADGYADGELVYDVWYCDNCNHCIDDGINDPEALPNFCPNCGASMKEGDHAD